MMELTAVGGLWLAAVAVLLFLPLPYMAGFVLFSAVFQAAAVVNAGGKGIMPLLVAEAALLLRWLVQGRALRLSGRLAAKHSTAWVLVFCIYACLATLLLPLLFHGTVFTSVWYRGVVYPPPGVSWAGVVSLNGNNARKLVSLLLHGGALVVFTATRQLMTEQKIEACLKVTVAVAVLIGWWETAAKNNLIPFGFPDGFFYNNMGYTLKGMSGWRTNFTFAEPSYAGGFFASLLMAYLAAGWRKSYGTVLLLVSAVLLSLAGTTAVTLAAGLLLLLLFHPPKAGRIRAVGALALLAMALLFSSYGNRYYHIVTTKMSDFSGRERMAGVVYGFKVWAQSFGLGVGMGTVRTFSLITELMSSLGIVGLVGYVALLCCLLGPLIQHRNRPLARFSVVFVLCHLVAQCAALPDITTPTMWMGLYVAAASAGLLPHREARPQLPLHPHWRGPAGILSYGWRL